MPTKVTFASSKSTIETLEKMCYMVDVNNKNTRNDVVLMFILGTYLTPVSTVSIVDFEQVNVSWVRLF